MQEFDPERRWAQPVLVIFVIVKQAVAVPHAEMQCQHACGTVLAHGQTFLVAVLQDLHPGLPRRRCPSSTLGMDFETPLGADKFFPARPEC